MSKWVSIKERKPQDGVMKLMCNMKARELRHVVYVGWFAGGIEVPQGDDKKATHWMDLPPLPEGEQQ